jgi:hypothetical protein
MTDLTTTASVKTKAIAAGLAFAAALVLGWASFSHAWAVETTPSAEQGPGDHFGLRAFERCYGPDDCETHSIYELVEREHGPSSFPLFGWIASVAMWIGAAALAAAAALMLAGRFVARPIALTTVALIGLAVGLVAGFVFLALKPAQQFGPGPAFWGFVGGELAGIAGTILVARIRPRDPEWDDPRPFNEETW